MANLLETPYRLSQNFLDFMGQQFHIIADGLGFSEDEPFDLPESFYGDGVAYVSIFLSSDSYPTFGLLTCNISVTPDTLNGNGDIYSNWQLAEFTNTSSPVLDNRGRFYYFNSSPKHASSEFLPWVLSFNLKPQANTFTGVRYNPTGASYSFNRPPFYFKQYNGVENYSFGFDVSPLNASDFPLSVNSSNINAFPYQQTTFAVKYIPNNFNVSVKPSSVGISGYVYHYTFTDNNNVQRTIEYAYNDNNTQVSIVKPSFPVSYNDLKGLFNASIIPNLSETIDVEPNIIFPDFSAPDPPPFAYIEPVHKINYDLELPDTSDFLNVQAVSRPLSFASDSIAYLWNTATDLGFAPCLGFCLVATLIVKGLRGD